MKGNFIRGIYSGMLVSFGGIIFLSVENRYLGAFLFSFALLTILVCGFDLFTGKVGYARTLDDAKRLGIMLLGNFVGCGIIAELAHAGMDISSAAVVAKKLSHTPLESFILAMFCGVMMYMAVDCFKRSQKNTLFVILPIMIFMLAGFEPSIANTFYILFAREYTAKAFGYLALMVVGNGVGSLLFSLSQPFIAPVSTK